MTNLKKFSSVVASGIVLSLLVSCAGRISDPQAEKLIRVARDARNSGNLEAAVNFYKKAKEIDERDYQIYLGLSDIYIQMKLLDAAEEYLKLAEKYEAPADKVGYLRGKIYLLSNKEKLAKKEFLKYRSVDCLNALGTIYDQAGDHEKAQKIYKEVIVKDPNYIEAYNNLGLSLLQTQKYKEAVFYLEGACALPNADVNHRSNLAMAYGLCGNVEQAKRIYSQDFEGKDLVARVAYIEDMLANMDRSNSDED
ncbi:MAG: tetratricopeptide repeat protein [Alphaproteobacteria bacterium]|nr:tetratricopeptide repeat protein [Alphaproteobacteria bacterium]